ncbi:MAG: phosphodiester glycosidase family protein [Limnochordaceae bacterium]|nr:phosphodiester glycosidase family protein [Limnochordaceae bacterium]
MSESQVLPVAPGVTQVEERYTSSGGGRLVVHRLNVDLSVPTARLRLSLPRGEVLPLETPSARAQRESTPQEQVVAAINGDFYTVTPPFAGLPIGTAVREGELVNSGVESWFAFGVWPDGKVDIDKVVMLGEVEFSRNGQSSGTTYSLSQVNRARSGLTLFTRRFGATTLADDQGIDVVVKADNLPLRAGVPLTGTVVQVISNQRNTAIPEDGFVLSAAGSSRSALEDVAVGDRVTVQVRLWGLKGRSWDTVSQVVGGNVRLVEEGEVADFSTVREPRTAVGYKGKMVYLVTWDGRQPGWSDGASYQEEAQYFVALGAQEALNLDGGGSTAFVVRQPGAPYATVANRPSDGWERAVSNSLQVVSTAQGQGLAQLLVLPPQVRLVPGASAQFQVMPLDAAGNKVELPSGQAVVWSAEGGIGQVDSDGRFTATTDLASGSASASASGSASAPALASTTSGAAGGDKNTGTETQLGKVGLVVARVGQVTGQAVVTVAGNIQRLELRPASVSLDPGQKMTFQVVAFDDQGRKVEVPAAALRWRVSPEAEPGGVGHFDPQTLQFVAGEGSGQAQITVALAPESGLAASAQGLTAIEATATVAVGQPPFLIEDFDDLADLTSDGARYRKVTLAGAHLPGQPVRWGKGAVQLSYDFTGQPSTSGAYVMIRGYRELPGYPKRVGVWVYGDGAGHWLRGQLRDGTGTPFPVDFTDAAGGVNWTGWRFVEADIPAGKTLPLRFDALRLMETHSDRKNAGVVYFDNLVAIYSDGPVDVEGPAIDLQAPNLAADGSTVLASATPTFRAVITDSGEPVSGVDWKSLSVTLDGKAVTPGFDPDSGIVTFQVIEPLAAGEHVLTISVNDRAGNPAAAPMEWRFRVAGQ